MKFRRTFWLERLEEAWKERSVVWLTGVRRSGKTTLCQSLENVEYFDCELPRVRQQIEDPESFLESLQGKRVVLDEVHRLLNPSELLKIAADHYPHVKIVATGSSTLTASAKFRDTLTGRKRTIWLTPMMSRDLSDFRRGKLEHRLLFGGLPSFFLEQSIPERAFQEWIDAFWAKDIQELFRLERRASFQRFFELLMIQSGGIFEASSFAAPCEISRTTVTNYLHALEATHVVQIVRPYTKRRAHEIIAAPRVYAFDTGFISYYRGWHAIRADDLGALWEHYVLNEMIARLDTVEIRYWRDKRGHEVDFVIPRRGLPPIAVECKWSSRSFDGQSMSAFQRAYPEAQCCVVAHDVSRRFTRKDQGGCVEFMSLEDLVESLEKK
ncbi:MAG: ATP-binding protein [Planctomycetes bacterium]|nr:ATP-binding protein [Planctomycetota bacterium]